MTKSEMPKKIKEKASYFSTQETYFDKGRNQGIKEYAEWIYVQLEIMSVNEENQMCSKMTDKEARAYYRREIGKLIEEVENVYTRKT